MSEPPPPPVITDNIVVQDHISFGRSAFAAKDIPAGSIVICEEPLLGLSLSKEDKVLAGLLKQIHQYVTTHKDELGQDAELVHPHDWVTNTGLYMQFCRAPKSVQEQVLRDMFSRPEAPDMDSTAPVVRSNVQAAVLAALAPLISKILKMEATVAAAKGFDSGPEVTDAKTDAAQIKKVLLAAELNVHQFQNDSAAMYVQGSKLAHTCEVPNTSYKSFQTRGCHVAMRDIAEGELLTTTYLPAELHIASTDARRQYLEQTFSFTCRCPRCSEQIDKLCNVPCLRCCPPELQRSSKGYLPPAAHNHPADLGLLFWDPKNASSSSSSGADPGSPDSEPQPKPWQCNRCGAEFVDQDSELVGDYEMIRTATARLRTWAYGNFVSFDPQDGQQRLEHVAVVLGSSNWAVQAMTAKQSEYMCAIIRHIGGQLQDKQKAVSADTLQMLSHAVQLMGQNLLHIWSWATETIGMAAEEAADRLVQPLVLAAATLFFTSAHLLDVPKLRNTQQSLISKMQLLATDLSSKAEPALAKYRAWVTPEPHPLLKQLLMARALAEVQSQAAAADLGEGGALSMQQLQDFLPNAGSKAVGAAPKGKAKKKAGGKK